MKNVFWYLFAIGLTLNLTGAIDWDWYLVIAPLIFGTVLETAIAIQEHRVTRANKKWNNRKTPALEQRENDHERRIARKYSKHLKNR